MRPLIFSVILTIAAALFSCRSPVSAQSASDDIDRLYTSQVGSSIEHHNSLSVLSDDIVIDLSGIVIENFMSSAGHLPRDEPNRISIERASASVHRVASSASASFSEAADSISFSSDHQSSVKAKSISTGLMGSMATKFCLLATAFFMMAYMYSRR